MRGHNPSSSEKQSMARIDKLLERRENLLGPKVPTLEIERAVRSLEKSGHGISALVICPFFANEGFPSLQKGFLDEGAAIVRKAGGIIIADEVQPGFGRIGTHWWGHEKVGIQPEIVTLGKPMGNGHPVAAVVTGRDVLAKFRNAFSYFNTFGGNPVSCAAAMAVLRVLEDEELVENARKVGEYALERFSELQAKYPFICDVRGSGLFFGAETVLDDALTPAPEFTARVVEGMKEQGILLSRLGVHDNTLKIRPPMVFSRENADQLVETLDMVLEKTPLET